MPIRFAPCPKTRRSARPKPSRISGAIRGALAATTAMFVLAAAQAAPTPVADLTQVGAEAPAAVVGPVEILQSGDIDFGNTDDVYASTDAAPYDVTAVLLHSYDGDVAADNAAGASIAASIEADGGYVVAQGLASYGANSFISNSGDIEATADVELGNSLAVGVASLAPYFSTVYNEADGSISASASSGQGTYYGPDANAFAVVVTGTSAYVVNEGQIAAQAQADGEFSIAAATGVHTEGYYGFATAVNYGEVSAYARTTSDADTKTYAFAYGIDTRAHYGYFTASTVNYGDVLASTAAFRGGAISYAVRTSGNYAYTANEADASVSAVSRVEYSGIADATGVMTDGLYYAHDVNHGDISAYASSHDLASYGFFTYGAASATGVRETAYFLGGVVMENTGSISATAVTRDVAGFFFGLTNATGVYQHGKYYAGLDNDGDIHATAYAELGVVSAYGALSRSKYGAYTVVENHEGASIIAVAESGSAADDYRGGIAISHGVHMFGGSFALVYNDGEISASAFVNVNDRDYIDSPALSYAYGIEQRGSYGATLVNSGSIEAYAGSDFGYASAYGAMLTGLYYAVTYNQGEITTVADADDGGAFAVGLYMNAPGRSVPQYCGPYGCTDYIHYGGLAATLNEGGIHALADAQDGLALSYGVVSISRLEGSLDNSGEIIAVARAGGGEADAIGVLLRSDYATVAATNSGTIAAAAYGDDASATALWLLGGYGASVYNAGNIVAGGDGERIAISSLGGGGGVVIENQGLVSGSVLLGDGDDYLYNGGDGELRLEDAMVDLGLAGSDGNRFENAGLVRVLGDSSINMGGGFTLVPSANPYAFYNDGAIDFQDGAADDVLTVTGDFAGAGDINVDASGFDGVSDLLYIDGSVVAGTAATINVELLDLAESIEGLVPTIYVSGDSASGNFVLGDVAWDEANSFVTLDFELVADLDPTNARPDIFALGIEVGGLSDTGTLAASVVPAVHSLVNSQVGSWRQRMGVLEGFNNHGVALWARVFQDEGGLSPAHAAPFGSGGNFGWKQRNAGVEGGIDFAVSGELDLGLLVSTSHADTHLQHPGNGSGNIDADTWGIYGTWISAKGYYLDASFRWSSLDVGLRSAAGVMDTEADAETLNLEMGYAWTMPGGLKVEPQFQYTKTSVDGLGTLVTVNGMSFRSDGGDSSRGRLGVSFRKRFGEADNWTWTPYGSLSAVREFDGASRYAVNDDFIGETTVEGTSALLEAGFTAVHRNWSIHGGINWQEGGAVNGFLGGQLGLRYNF